MFLGSSVADVSALGVRNAGQGGLANGIKEGIILTVSFLVFVPRILLNVCPCSRL